MNRSRTGRRTIATWQRKHRQQTAPEQQLTRRAEDSAAAGAVRRRAGTGEDGAGERTHRADVAGFGTAAANRKRRPGRRPSGQALGVDHHRSVSAWRSEAASHVSAVAGRQPLARRGPRSAPSTTCASCSSTTIRRCSSPPPSMATGTPISTTSSTKIPRLSGSHGLCVGRLAGDSQPGVKDYLVKHQITAEGWYVANPDLTVAEIATAEAHRQGG